MPDGIKTKKKKMDDYTVVGLYADNQQAYVGWHSARSGQEAVKRAKMAMKKNSSGGNNSVFAVFLGKHMDVYGKNELYTG